LCPFLQEFREYCSDVVGMLRDKESFLLELQSTVAQTLMAQRDVAQKRRIEYQEKALAAMRHVRMIHIFFICSMVLTRNALAERNAGFDGGIYAFKSVRNLR
jgi:hypothetical protein